MENSSNNNILIKDIAAIVVWYNPTILEVKNIDSYIDYIDHLYIFDNTPKKNNEYLLKNLNKNKIKYISLNENKGIAFALNYAAKLSYLNNYKWILTMDQDSYFLEETFKNYLCDLKNIQLNKTGILSPNYHYENKELEENKGIQALDTVITSGNLVNLKIWKKIGRFDEKLFIDEVDHEYCYRLKKNGFKIYKIGDVTLKHILGKSCEKKIFGKKIKYTEHNAFRKYYIFRNSLYIMNLYPEYKKKYIKKLFKETIKILFLEKDTVNKIKSILLSLKDYKNL